MGKLAPALRRNIGTYVPASVSKSSFNSLAACGAKAAARLSAMQDARLYPPVRLITSVRGREPLRSRSVGTAEAEIMVALCFSPHCGSESESSSDSSFGQENLSSSAAHRDGVVIARLRQALQTWVTISWSLT